MRANVDWISTVGADIQTGDGVLWCGKWLQILAITTDSGIRLSDGSWVCRTELDGVMVAVCCPPARTANDSDLRARLDGAEKLNRDLADENAAVRARLTALVKDMRYKGIRMPYPNLKEYLDVADEIEKLLRETAAAGGGATTAAEGESER